MDCLPIDKNNALSEYTWGEDCFGWNLVDTEGLSIKQELMPSDTSEQLHYHEQAKQFFYVLSGTATFEIDGDTLEVTKHQGIEINPGQKHRIVNREPHDLEFILYSQPSTKNDRINC